MLLRYRIYYAGLVRLSTLGVTLIDWNDKIAASKQDCFHFDKLHHNEHGYALFEQAISKREQPDTFEESKTIAKRGGKVAKNARTDIESQLGQSVVSPLNASDKPALEVKTDSDEEKD